MPEAIVPPRVNLTNVETGNTVSAQFNPDELKEKVVVNFTDLEILGLSHKPQQYKNTDNLAYTFELSFDSKSTRGIELSGGLYGSARPDLARRFLLSLCYPMAASAGDVLGGGTPRVILSWPGLCYIVGRMRSIEFTHKRFSSMTGESTYFTANVTIHQALLKRQSSEDVLANGTFQSGEF